MSNQTHANQTVRYDLANRGHIEFALPASAAVTTATDTKVTGMVVVRESGISTNVTEAAGVFTIAKAGLYSVTYTMNFVADAAGTFRNAKIVYTPFGGAATEFSRQQIAALPSAAAAIMSGSICLNADKGDLFEIFVEQDSGGDVDLFGSAVLNDPRSKLTFARVA